jgi:hypothetical protein
MVIVQPRQKAGINPSWPIAGRADVPLSS